MLKHLAALACQELLSSQVQNALQIISLFLPRMDGVVLIAFSVDKLYCLNHAPAKRLCSPGAQAAACSRSLSVLYLLSSAQYHGAERGNEVFMSDCSMCVLLSPPPPGNESESTKATKMPKSTCPAAQAFRLLLQDFAMSHAAQIPPRSCSLVYKPLTKDTLSCSHLLKKVAIPAAYTFSYD